MEKSVPLFYFMKEKLEKSIKEFNQYLFKHPLNSTLDSAYLKGVFFTTFRRHYFNSGLTVKDILELDIKNNSLHFLKFGNTGKHISQDKKIVFAILNSTVGNINFDNLKIKELYFFNFLHQSNAIIQSINNYKI